MFTGKMDVEGPDARDGYQPSHPHRKRRAAPKPRIDWKEVPGTMRAWMSMSTAHRVELDDGGNYNVFYGLDRIGSFRNIVDATKAAEVAS